MLTIFIPNNNIPEREYIIRTLISEFLGLQHKIVVRDEYSNYSICFNHSELVIQDGLFSRFPEALSYLSGDFLPENIAYIKNEFTSENDLPVIYGSKELSVSENRIICGVDIFASSFFMLSRWEEYVNNSRDEHDRFPGNESIACKNKFLPRPVVNEYVEMLWNMIRKLGYRGQRKKRQFELALTHDVDSLSYVSYRSLLGDIIKRKNLKLARNNLRYLFSQDPHDTYDFLMTISENLGVKSRFYFMSTDSKRLYDTGYYLNRKMFSSRIKEIIDRGHIVGFHPGYYTFNDDIRWRYEKRLLQDSVQQEISEGRQHFLRMDVSKTLLLWERNNMSIDSTLGYAGREGFRCGTGDLFPVFNFLERKELRLKERPLVIMDGTLRQYQNYNREQVLEVIQYYITISKKYNSVLTLLFHNSSFYLEWEGYDSIYSQVLGSKSIL